METRLQCTECKQVKYRPSPRISIGLVDASTAVAVVDARNFDMPIIYASDHNIEIVGKICHFLRAPGGPVEQGSKRKHTDDVYHIRQHVADGKEVQTSIVNYRKDGSSFTDLITIMPVPGDTEEIAYFTCLNQDEPSLFRIRPGVFIAV